MAYQRGDLVLIPFPFSDLKTTKTRPALVVSSTIYHANCLDILLAYVSSQVTRARQPLDYIIADWQTAGLLKPSFIRPKVATVDPSLIRYHIGRLSDTDLKAVDTRLQIAFDLDI